MPKVTRIAWSCSSVDEWTAYQEDYKAWVQDTVVGRSPLHESEMTESAEKRAIRAARQAEMRSSGSLDHPSSVLSCSH
eukprot:CAMPEP_0198222256 /NCGR_PEP_ID=MMETSP1445-20131203/87325_1 /TAXON_ID=36898 /ORGANISM="Pyramimonas sp., Strain CCMP2087" /LENGTH=77 /DNA_ID=CAMNT_0043900697 /DNA_START=166 /DNA_END=396 /DNA_ORIENTATION=+